MFTAAVNRIFSYQYLGFSLILVYGLMINPYSGEFIEFGQNLNGSVEYSSNNSPGLQRINEVSGLIQLAGLIEAFTSVLTTAELSILSGLMIYGLAYYSVYFFLRTLGATQQESFYLLLSLFTVFFGNIAAYPLYFPGDFFSWGQIAFYIFLIWVSFYIRGDYLYIVFGSFFLSWIHPVYGVISLGLISLRFLSVKAFGYVFAISGNLALIYFYYKPEGGDKSADLKWSENLHHLLNNDMSQIFLLLFFSIISLVFFFGKNRRLLLEFSAASIFIILLIYFASSFGNIAPKFISTIVFRANFSRFYDVYLIMSYLAFFLFCLRVQERIVRKQAVLILFALPIPIYWGFPPVYQQVFYPALALQIITVILIGNGFFDAFLKFVNIKKLIRYDRIFVFLSFVFVGLMGFNIDSKYNMRNDIYQDGLKEVLVKNSIESLVTPGLVHGVESFNVQLASDLPFWVPFSSDLYCGDRSKNDYVDYVNDVRACFSSRSKVDWQLICEQYGHFAIIDFESNGLNLPYEQLFLGSGVVVYDVCR